MYFSHNNVNWEGSGIKEAGYLCSIVIGLFKGDFVVDEPKIHFGALPKKMQILEGVIYTGQNLAWDGTVSNLAGCNQSYMDVATAFGGGLDVSLGKLISVRPARLDLLSTWRSYDTHHTGYNRHPLDCRDYGSNGSKGLACKAFRTG
jgi:hypothetical protein